MYTMLQEGKHYSNHTIRQRTPVGTLFITIVEDNNRPVALFVNGAKTGTELYSFCDGISRLATEILDGNKDGLPKLLEHLSSMTSDKLIKGTNGVECRSGIDGIYIALLTYQRVKMAELAETFFGAGKGYRPARLHQHSRAS